MKAYVVVSGAIFAVLVVVHLWRMVVERTLVGQSGFIFVTAVAAAMSIWAFSSLRLAKRR